MGHALNKTLYSMDPNGHTKSMKILHPMKHRHGH